MENDSHVQPMTRRFKAIEPCARSPVLAMARPRGKSGGKARRQPSNDQVEKRSTASEASAMAKRNWVYFVREYALAISPARAGTRLFTIRHGNRSPQ